MSRYFFFQFSILVCCLFLTNSCHQRSNRLLQSETSSLTIPQNVSLPSIEEYLNESDSVWSLVNQQVRTIYLQSKFQKVWVNNNGLTKSGQQLVQELKHSAEYGLSPTFYPLLEDDSYVGLSDEQQNYLDLTLCYHAINFISHVSVGIKKSHDMWQLPENQEFRDKITQSVQKVINGENIASVLQNSEPQYYLYRNLKGSIKQNVLPTFWPDPSFSVIPLQKQDIQVLKALSLIGFYKGSLGESLPPSEFVYKSFQYKWGLPLTGKLDMNTCALLYRQVYNSFKKIAVNMERLRQNPPETGTYIWVDIPAFSLDVVENGKYICSHKIIVGAPLTPTPILEGKMSHVLTYPRWNIPPSIIKKEVIPAMLRDSAYLTKKGYEVNRWSGQRLNPLAVITGSHSGDFYPFNVSQPPGEDNALGILKFLFNNNESVYLHDTNSRSLFMRKYRALSHGCIRVQDPVKLASFLLDSLSLKQMHNQLLAHKTGHIAIRKQVGIYIRYVTCRASDDGQISWFSDIYERDEEEWKNMQRALFILTPSR